MQKGYLSEYFTGVAAKVLSAVEADAAASNQHEYNGAAPLKKMFGTARRTFPARFIYLNDSDDEPVTDSGTLTWYDAREAHPTRTEYRWRQVLSEADRISEKHLLTFEAAISVNQTREMEYNRLQLVVPDAVHSTYTQAQQKWLMNVSDFIEMLLFRQRAVTWR